jgi:hypothetical protein
MGGHVLAEQVECLLFGAAFPEMRGLVARWPFLILMPFSGRGLPDRGRGGHHRHRWPWERGSDENLNRIVREFFPKGGYPLALLPIGLLPWTMGRNAVGPGGRGMG